MKVPCKKCNAEMQYPYRKCKKCGWKPEGKFLEKAEAFARNYEKVHGIEPKKTERKAKGSTPSLLRPPPGKDVSSKERKGPKRSKKKRSAYEPETFMCPKCGEVISIMSPERPLRLTCENCRAKIKVVD